MIDQTEELMKNWAYEQFIEYVSDAIEEVDYRLHMYNNATDKANAAHHFVELHNAIGNLKTWHKNYDGETGTLAWEREDQSI